MKLTGETKLFLGISVFTALLVAGAALVMTRPVKPRAKEELILPTTYTNGLKDASVWLVEFSDFQCPACKAFSSAVSDLVKQYPDTLLVAYRYFPLDNHPESIPSALAAESAGKQGKFWEMEQVLFANQERLSDSTYRELATLLGLDMQEFARDLTDPAVRQKVLADLAYGQSVGVNATPTFFLNGIKLNSLSPADFIKEVEKALSK